jgi:hypothetical protein
MIRAEKKKKKSEKIICIVLLIKFSYYLHREIQKCLSHTNSIVCVFDFKSFCHEILFSNINFYDKNLKKNL